MPQFAISWFFHQTEINFSRGRHKSPAAPSFAAISSITFHLRSNKCQISCFAIANKMAVAGAVTQQPNFSAPLVHNHICVFRGGGDIVSNKLFAINRFSVPIFGIPVASPPPFTPKLPHLPAAISLPHIRNMQASV